LFRSSTHISGFFRREGRKASCISSGKTPGDNERFTIEVIGIARTSENLSRREVGIGSR
jgi:hypothetical protein